MDEGFYYGLIYGVEADILGDEDSQLLSAMAGLESTWSQSHGWHTEPILVGDFQAIPERGGVGVYGIPQGDELGGFIYFGNPHAFAGAGVTLKPSLAGNFFDANYWNGNMD